MDKRQQYDSVFRKAFSLDADVKLDDLDILSVENWTSIEHIEFVSLLEDEFKITISNEDIFQLTSYKSGLRLLERMGIIR